MTADNEQETLNSIAERQKRLETGLLVLSASFDEFIEQLGGGSLAAKFRSREQFYTAVQERIRRDKGNSRWVGRAASGQTEHGYGAAASTVLLSPTD